MLKFQFQLYYWIKLNIKIRNLNFARKEGRKHLFKWNKIPGQFTSFIWHFLLLCFSNFFQEWKQGIKKHEWLIQPLCDFHLSIFFSSFLCQTHLLQYPNPLKVLQFYPNKKVPKIENSSTSYNYCKLLSRNFWWIKLAKYFQFESI